MDITEVRIKLTDDPHDRLKAFCSITFDDCFVVRDLKVIEGSSGVFVAMPSRKIMTHCRGCRAKNHLRAAFCNDCGRKLSPESQQQRGEEGPLRLYADVAHPINAACRELIQDRVLDAFDEELQRAQRPGYVSTYDDDYDDDLLDALDFGESGEPDASAPPVVDERAARAPTRSESRPPERTASAPRRHADEEPRGPHKKPVAAPATSAAKNSARLAPNHAATPKQAGNEFGAGVF